MPKKILVSNSGSYQEISASYDDNNALSSSIRLVLSTSSFAGQSGLMQVFQSKLIPIPSIGSPDYDPGPDNANYSGSVLSYRTGFGFGPNRTETPGFSGDISGDLLTKGVKVRSLANVETGTLSSLYGGTSTTSYVVDSLVTTSGSGPIYDGSDKVIAVLDNDGTWGLADKSILTPPIALMTESDVRLYTGSAGVTGSGTWTKPPGAKFVRVICQGGGGGGKGALQSTVAACGGGGGGYADVIFNAEIFTSPVQVTVGYGGNGGAGGTTGANGSPGISSSFGDYLYANGGNGGTTTIVAGGYGYNTQGGSGSATLGNATAISDVTIGGAGGARGYPGSDPNFAGYLGGSVTNLNLISKVASGSNCPQPNSGTLFNFTKYYINNTLYENSSLPYLIWAGGGGGAFRTGTGFNGGTPEFGSGGGGGGKGTTGGGNGGNGGKGYVLVISW